MDPGDRGKENTSLWTMERGSAAAGAAYNTHSSAIAIRCNLRCIFSGSLLHAGRSADRSQGRERASSVPQGDLIWIHTGSCGTLRGPGTRKQPTAPGRRPADLRPTQLAEPASAVRLLARGEVRHPRRKQRQLASAGGLSHEVL